MASQQQLPTPLSATLASPTSLHLPRNSHILMDVDTSSNTNTDDLEEEAATVASSPDLDLTHQHSPPASATGPTLPSFHALLGNSTALSKTPGSKQRKTSARLPTPKGLTRSQRIALNPPPKTIQCEFPGCSKRFVYQSQYKSHFLVHNRDRPYACDFEGCNSSYTTRNRLKIHQRTHTGEKPYKCTYPGCDYASVQKCTLDAHEVLNHGSLQEKEAHKAKKQVKNLPCNVCGKLLVSQTSFEAHYWQAHGNAVGEAKLEERKEVMSAGSSEVGSGDGPSAEESR